MLTATLVVAGCGDDGGSASDGVSACGGGSLLAQVTIASGNVVRLVEMPDGHSVCVVEGAMGPNIIGLEDAGDSPTAQITNSGSSTTQGWWYLFLIPAGWPRGSRVVSEDGTDLVVGWPSSGRHLLVFDPTAGPQIGPESLVMRRWQVIGADGAVLVDLEVEGAPSNSAPTDLMEVVACLEGQGLDPAATQPYAPDIAGPAWKACRTLDLAAMRSSGATPEQVDDTIAFVDCVVTRGWIPILLPAGFDDSGVSVFSECEAASPVPAGSGTSTATAAPATVAPNTSELLAPNRWIGRIFAESSLAAPFPEVTLDGAETGLISAMVGCGFNGRTDVCPAFVRTDPGGYGHSGIEPGTWVVLAWQPTERRNISAGGPVVDAVAAVTTDDNAMPAANCRSTIAATGNDTYLAFIACDPAFRPSDKTRSSGGFGAHPVIQAWRIGKDLQLEEVPAKSVECTIYSYGD